ncbi:MAG: NAD(P)-dependent methylenetetrahydromethanopterin dehydrogenase [Gemmatimonadota bacterium]
MKKLLLQLDVDRLPSAFDSVVALDAGADDLLRYGGVTPGDVAGFVQGAIFTRGPKDLARTAIFVGGGDVHAAQKVFDQIPSNFFGPFKVSAMLDPNGSNTTAAAAVRSVERVVGDLRGRRAVVLAGVGAVGSRTVAMLVHAGASVRFTGSNPERLAAKLQELRRALGEELESALAPKPGQAGPLLEGAEILIAAGPEGVKLLDETDWKAASDLRVAVDLNAVPPLGIAGIEAGDDAAQRHGKTVFGALGVGKLKMKIHRRCIAALFESNDRSFDADTIFELSHSL